MMNIKKLSTTAFVASAVALAISGAAASGANAMSDDQEKCYGVVKAGHNDCGAEDGSHSCMGQATVDGAGWVAMPAGLCEKLVGGSLTPVVAEAEGSDEEMMEEEMHEEDMHEEMPEEEMYEEE
jgi:uncharacterized membrane protein